MRRPARLLFRQWAEGARETLSHEAVLGEIPHSASESASFRDDRDIRMEKAAALGRTVL